jgi:uncharacterized protein YjbI with pentapeptide repeats
MYTYCTRSPLSLLLHTWTLQQLPSTGVSWCNAAVCKSSISLQLPIIHNTKYPKSFSQIRVQFSSVQFSSVQLSSVQVSSDQFSSVQISSARFSSIRFSSVQFCSVQFSSVQLSSAQFSSAQFSSGPSRRYYYLGSRTVLSRNQIRLS